MKKNTLDEGSSARRGGQFEGNVRIADDVIIELVKKTMSVIPNVQPATTGLASKFGIGRKGGDGIRVLSVEDGKIPATTVDVYIRTKYGYRIPDLVWDVQEKIKSNLERYTGYTVTAVNVNVQGIYMEDPKDAPAPEPEPERRKTPEKTEKSEPVVPVVPVAPVAPVAPVVPVVPVAPAAPVTPATAVTANTAKAGSTVQTKEE